jgi:low temperature requirement protein LtrA
MIGVLLADCASTPAGERLISAIVLIAVVLVWAGIGWLSIWFEAEPEERGWLALVAIAAAVVSAVVFYAGRGFGRGGFDLFLVALLAIGAVSLCVALWSERFGPFRALGASVVGALLVPGGMILLFFWWILVGGHCLD